MQKEIIYKFQILLFSKNAHHNGQDTLIASIMCEHWEFPSDEELMAAITDNGADYAEVRRIYTVDTIPFTEEEEDF